MLLAANVFSRAHGPLVPNNGSCILPSSVFYFVPTLVDMPLWCAPIKTAAAAPNNRRVLNTGWFLQSHEGYYNVRA